MSTVAVTGSSGFIGSALVDALRGDGHDVIRFVRRQPTQPEEAGWDPSAGSIDRDALARADAVVHLAGEGIGEKRWTSEQKRKIITSRVEGTSTVARALADLAGDGVRPVLVTGSAIGYYGLRGDEILTEESSAGSGFLAEVCQQWEASAKPAEDAGLRVVRVRTGIVLGRSGAMGRMLPLFKVGLGGKLGSGRQWWSWVSLADEVGIIRHAIDTPGLEGPINATAPNPATNAEITKALGKVLGRPAVVPVPTFALSVVMGKELTDEVIMAGQRVLPEVAKTSGYSFRHPTLEEGLRAAITN